MSRFCSAAIETSIGIVRSTMPKSTAWLFIQAYYSAFYAAHSILRSVGISASNLRSTECIEADKIASALGFNSAPLSAAQYRCEYLVGGGRLNCLKAPGPGIHEQFWRIFDGFLQNTMTAVMQNQQLASSDAQDIFVKLNDLRSVLTWGNHSAGNWLSSIRNEVTYMQRHMAWFPYGRSRADCNRLFALHRQWSREPESINLRTAMSTDAELFIVTCAFLVSLSVALVRDMALRHPTGDSFLIRGPLKLFNLSLY